MPAKTYGVLNPEQLARLFEMRADISFKQAQTEGLASRKWNDVAVWAEAIYIIRNTEFVGWTPDSRIVLPVTSEASREGP